MEVGRRGNGRRSSLSQINVTPLVDVMLVLLVIFMVTTPMMDKGVNVNLPQVKRAPNLAASKEPLVVTVERNGAISVGHSHVDKPEKLIPILQQILRERKEKEVFLKADRAVPYGRVVQVMAAVKKAGVERLGMVAEEPQR